MRRARTLAPLAVLAVLAGCGADFVAGDARFERVSTQELAIRVRISKVSDEPYASVTVTADVTAPSAAWVSLTGGDTASEWPPSGSARRTRDGAAELQWGPDWIRPDLCVDRVCELEYVLALDAPPTEPWDAAISVTMDGAASDETEIEIVAR